MILQTAPCFSSFEGILVWSLLQKGRYVSMQFYIFHLAVTSLIAKVYSYLCVVSGNESSVAEVDSKPSAWTRASAALMDV